MKQKKIYLLLILIIIFLIYNFIILNKDIESFKSTCMDFDDFDCKEKDTTPLFLIYANVKLPPKGKLFYNFFLGIPKIYTKVLLMMMILTLLRHLRVKYPII